MKGITIFLPLSFLSLVKNQLQFKTILNQKLGNCRKDSEEQHRSWLYFLLSSFNYNKEHPESSTWCATTVGGFFTTRPKKECLIQARGKMTDSISLFRKVGEMNLPLQKCVRWATFHDLPLALESKTNRQKLEAASYNIFFCLFLYSSHNTSI